LSRFTGASRELRDAIIVNPYDIEQLSDAIRMALEMDATERHRRMQRMRRNVKEHNVYRWAGNLITDLSEIRIDEPRPEDGHDREEKEPSNPSSRLAIVSRKAGAAGGD
jgi:trehalose 6-phosphate synthase